MAKERRLSEEQKQLNKEKKQEEKALIEAKKVSIRKGEEALFEEYKANLPQILDEKLNNLAIQLAETEEVQGLSAIEINELLRAKNVFWRAKYTAEELMVIFEYYRKAIVEINKRKKFLPTKENFCSFAGINTTTYNAWLLGTDEEKTAVIVLIDDYIKENMLTSAQLGEIREVSTIFRGKASHGMVEASSPFSPTAKTQSDLAEINRLIENIQNMQKKK